MTTENEWKLKMHEEDLDCIDIELVSVPLGTQYHKRLLQRRKTTQRAITHFKVRVNEESSKNQKRAT